MPQACEYLLEDSLKYLSTPRPKKFDALFHFDETRAVEPLERSLTWEADGVAEVDETYPSGL